MEKQSTRNNHFEQEIMGIGVGILIRDKSSREVGHSAAAEFGLTADVAEYCQELSHRIVHSKHLSHLRKKINVFKIESLTLSDTEDQAKSEVRKAKWK